MDIVIQNVPISFPFKPYGCQLSLMNRVIESLECGKNCLLESPTGTGKTMSLLCSSLAWLNKKIADANSMQAECEHNTPSISSADAEGKLFSSDLCPCATEEKESSAELPKIYYCTRTHKQISQVVRELRRTKYRYARMTILSSRQHSCINPSVKGQPDAIEACQKLNTNGVCPYDLPKKTSDVARALRKLDSGGVWDLEDLIDALVEIPSCPYFCARKLAKTADIVFCPYNYLLDPINRSASDLDLKGHVVILDEAHNIEDASREAASFKITENQLFATREDLSKLAFGGFEPGACGKLITMVDAMLKVMQLARSRLVRAGEEAEQTQVWSGQEISELLAMVELGPGKIEEMQTAHHHLVSKASDNESFPRAALNPELPTLASSSSRLFECLFTVLRYMFRNDQRDLADYRVVLMERIDFERKQTGAPPPDESPVWLSKSSSKAQLVESRELSLNFWCLNPSVVFSELAAEVRCLILASGTLSPLTSMEAELGVPFPLRLEANHIIGKDRVLVSALSHGPNGHRLCCTYQQQNTFSFQDEVGQLLLQSCRAVPGGVLCFLPSYGSLDKLLRRWETTDLLRELRQIKHVMVEPRSSVGLDKWLEAFYETVDAHCSSSKKQSTRVGSTNGALVLAVCRGKVSEGLDFADAYGRLVISIGIPYPAFHNPLVRQKRQFNDTLLQTSSSQQVLNNSSPLSSPCSVPNTSSPSLMNKTDSKTQVLSGSQWYDTQAYRALNQALGRCIRHMNDWGAILMVDARFVEQPSRYMSGISRWIKSRTVFYGDFPSFVDRLRDFVNHHEISAKIEGETEELEDIFSD